MVFDSSFFGTNLSVRPVYISNISWCIEPYGFWQKWPHIISFHILTRKNVQIIFINQPCSVVFHAVSESLEPRLGQVRIDQVNDENFRLLKAIIRIWFFEKKTCDMIHVIWVIYYFNDILNFVVSSFYVALGNNNLVYN